jgi:CRISPR-associated protein Csm1
MEEQQNNLVAYGSHLLASQLGQEWPPPGVPPASDSLAQAILRQPEAYVHDELLQLARGIVHDMALQTGLAAVSDPQPVTPIFDLLHDPLGKKPRDWPPPLLRALTLSALKPPNGSPADLWGDFWQTLNRLPTQSQLDTFFYLLAKCGWNVAGTVLERRWTNFEYGISVFEQFKAVAALVHCLDPALDENQPLTLIAGDLPGIQRVLYTITAKGAAKTLRGHSAFLQLLSDALVRLLLQHLDLPWANVVSNAGGNFLVVAPAHAIDGLDGWLDEINEKLLALHRGGLYLALGSRTIPARLYADGSPIRDADSLAEHRAELQRRLEASKQAAFAQLAPGHYAALFEPIGDGGGGDRCDVCHVEVDERTQVVESEGELLLCEQCHSFAFPSKPAYDSLAWSVANADRLLISEYADPISLNKYDKGKGNPPWNVVLHALGLDYEFIQPGNGITPKPGTLLSFTPDQFLPESPDAEMNYGFRFLSQLTPREDAVRKEIRDFGSMARLDSAGIPRYGVLRMDVDSLGQVMSGHRLTYADLLHVSALSNALDYFFGGMLDRIGRDCTDAWQAWTAEWSGEQVEAIHKLPYIIYAGGDDLFIVASWDLLPPLAQAIQERFDDFCQGRLTVSGGIAIAREKYPLYRAAEQAGLALDQSKDRLVEDKRTMLVTARKNAPTFLGVTLPWDDVAKARGLTEKLIRLLTGYPHPDDGKAPRALLQLLNYVAQLYRREAGSENGKAVKLGQWLPALHYGLRRMQRRVPDSLKKELAAILNQVLNLDALDGPGQRLQALDEKVREKKRRNEDVEGALYEDCDRAQAELRRAVRTRLDYTRRDWPVIRYLGLPVRWAEFLTRKED